MIKQKPSLHTRSNAVRDTLFFVYLCGMTAHNLGSGIDFFVARISFFVYFAVEAVLLLRKGRFCVSTLMNWYTLFVLLNLFSVLWAKNTTLVFYYVNNFVQILCMFLFLSQRIQDERDVDRILQLMVASLLYMCILLCLRTPLSAWGTERAGFAIGQHPNSLGMMLSTGSGFCLYLYARCKAKRTKLFYLCVYALFVIIALLSGSRKSIGMILSTSVLFLLGTQHRKRTLKNLAKQLATYTFTALFVYWLLTLIMTNAALYNTLGIRVLSMLEGGTGEGSIGERSFFIDQGFHLFSMHPLLGYGANNFVQYMTEIGHPHQVYSHNDFVELLSTLGLIGFFAYYWLPFRVLYSLFRRYLVDNQNKQAVLMCITLAVSLTFGWFNVNYMRIFENLVIALAFFVMTVSCTPGQGQSSK